MGTAAPSRFRWLLAPLFLAVVAIGVARWPSAPSSPVPAIESDRAQRVTWGGIEPTTVNVGLQAGWSVPDVQFDHGAGHHHDHGPAEAPSGDGDQAQPAGGAVLAGPTALLPPGAPTVGATIDVDRGRSIAVIHGAGSRQLAFRTGTGQRWDDWQTLSVGPDEGPDGLPGEEGADTPGTVAGPVRVGADASLIEFVVVGGDTSSFDVTFLPTVDDGGTDLSPAGATVAAAGAVGPAAPPIFARSQWASSDWDYQNEACDGGPSEADHLQALVVHHTVTANDYAESEVDDLLRAIHYSHVVVNGWCDIGYNFVIDRFGRIWEARTGSIDAAVIGGHARGFNTATVGVALLGQHQPGGSPSAVTPSTAAIEALEDLAAWKLGRHGVDPAGKTWLRNRASTPPLRLAGDTWHYVPTIVGHRDLGVTSCPGGHGIDVARALPAALVARRDVTLPYRWADWRAHSHGPGFVVADATGGVRPAGAAEPWSQAPATLPDGSPTVAVGATVDGGYLLTAAGSLVGFGASPAVNDRPAGANQVIDLVVRSDGRSGWVLDGQGGLHPFGGAGAVGSTRPAGGSPVAVAMDDDGTGYIVDRSGAIHPTGSAQAATINGLQGGATAVDIALGSGGGGWVLDSLGRLNGFGGVDSHRVQPPAAVVAVAPAEIVPGGWVLDAHGQLWPFGGARLVFPVATDVTGGGAVDLAMVGSIYRPEFVNGPDATFIGALYRLFLGREPSIVETDVDVTSLEQGTRRSALTGALARSEHWTGSNVDRMYRSVLGREPDDAGRAYWLGEIAGGLELADLGTYFYGSAEYAGAAGSTEAYVAELYDVLLGRQPDPEGLAYWVGLLDRGEATPPDVAYGFYGSVESRRDRAAALFERILGLAPTEEDREYWAEQLLAQGDGGVAASLAASSEFYRLAVDGPEP